MADVDPVVIDAGYFVKRVESKPDWLTGSGVVEICSVSNHISAPPDGWIEKWLHNELRWFNRIGDAKSVIPPGQEDAYRLFAYRILPEIFRGGIRLPLDVPHDVRPDPIPPEFRPLGFDSLNNSMESVLDLECSPLSCNSMATEIRANKFCLFPSLDAAIAGAVRFSLEQPEPGDYYVVEVLESR